MKLPGRSAQTRPVRRRVVLALAFAGLLCTMAAPASAHQSYRGYRNLANPSHRRTLTVHRVSVASRRVLGRVFAIRRGSLELFCGPRSCDVLFESALHHGRFFCGNTYVRATTRHVIVRYVVSDVGCQYF